MKKTIIPTLLLSCLSLFGFAQQSAQVQTVVNSEDSFNKLVARKGIKEGFLSVADPEGIVFKPQAVKIVDFYGKIDKQPGTLRWKPNFARISTNGDLAFTAGPYVYQNGKTEDDKVYGNYVSLWKADAENKLKLLIDVGIQHPQPDETTIVDFKDPDMAKKSAPSKDPFAGKKLMMANDNTFNHSLTISTMGTYKEFLSPEAHFYFPGFDPMIGSDKILKFLDNEAITISAETISANRSSSGDLAYSYGRARIKKGNIVSNYNYVRVWEIDAKHRWNVLLEIFSAIENE